MVLAEPPQSQRNDSTSTKRFAAIDAGDLFIGRTFL
jgi:hypothetical protein